MRRLKLAFAVLCLAWCTLALAVDGVTPREVRIGMANALSGPAAGLGLQLRAGANACFARVNAAGGVHGRSITLVSVDDAYDPIKTARATRELIAYDKVFALFGFVGTPTSAAAVPFAVKAGVPYLFPFTGAEFLRTPVQPLVFHLRASYYDEAEALVGHLAGELGHRKIALFIQDDEFGEAGKAGVVRALARRGLKAMMEARYTRNTISVEKGLAQIEWLKPEAVVFIGTYRPLATLVRRARAGGVTATFATVSFVGTSELIKHVGAAGEGIVISQVMPSPHDASDVLVRQYQADVPLASRNYGSLEGYADAEALVEALRRSGREPTREALLLALAQMKAEAGPAKVYLTRIADGKVAPVR
jgi:branched-chain amino acid transport system substrate-binding protein